MRAPRARAILPEMQPLNVTLEIRPEGDSFTGRAGDSRGVSVEFVGWLGLIAALDSLLSPGLAAEDALACFRPPHEAGS